MLDDEGWERDFIIIRMGRIQRVQNNNKIDLEVLSMKDERRLITSLAVLISNRLLYYNAFHLYLSTLKRDVSSFHNPESSITSYEQFYIGK